MNLYMKKSLGSARGKQFFTWQKIIIGILSLILFISILNVFIAPIKNAFYYAVAPISKSLWKAGNGTAGFLTPFFNIQGLARENSNLKQENEKLLSQIIYLHPMLAQNQAIQKVVQNTQEDRFALTATQTIGLDVNADTVLVDRGFINGVAENMPVISADKTLVGKVYKVYKNFSQVVLISNKNSVVDVKVSSLGMQDPANPPVPVLGAVKGSGNLSLYLDLVSSEAQIQPQDMVLSSGQEGVFPKNLLIGTLTSIDKNDLKPFQTAKIQPSFDIKSADTLFIITNYKQ